MISTFRKKNDLGGGELFLCGRGESAKLSATPAVMGLGLKPLGGFVSNNKKTLREKGGVGGQVIILTLICLKEVAGALHC